MEVSHLSTLSIVHYTNSGFVSQKTLPERIAVTKVNIFGSQQLMNFNVSRSIVHSGYICTIRANKISLSQHLNEGFRTGMGTRRRSFRASDSM